MDDVVFRLPDHFLEKYKAKKVEWGFQDAGGNSLGENTMLRTYSRLKEDGTKEKWWEVCQRVTQGTYTIQKQYCKENRLPWNDRKAQASAQEFYDRLFHFKFTPAGRGLAQMGSPLVMEKRNSASLLNCAVVSTKDIDRNDPGALFAWFTEALMYGIGNSADTLGAAKGMPIYEPNKDVQEFVVPDSREGWAESLAVLINSYLKPNGHKLIFNYDQVRPYGAPLKTFGGTASGPGPLRQIHEQISELFQEKIGQTLDSELIVDIVNLIGTAVVAGSSRRSAELVMGQPDDEAFINLKNPRKFPKRNSYDPETPGWSWASNNSIQAHIGMDYTPFLENIVENGEPGLIYLDVAKSRGRMIDPPDHSDSNIALTNPCGEQFLESYEMCNLSTIHINRAESKEDFERTLKFAFLYSKTVTLMPTGWPETNAPMMKNRRIGLSITGLAGWLDNHGQYEFRDWADQGYKIVKQWDSIYSEWLGIRESIRVTTQKPEGSISLLSGATPGCHWSPGGAYYLRAVRFGDSDPAVQMFKDAGYRVEKDLVSANTQVVYFPIKGASKRSEKNVSIFEKINLAAEVQKYWSDNGVSVTVSFDKESESKHVPTVLSMYEGQLKAVSFLPMGNETYPQQPYTEITEEEYNEWAKKLKKVNTNKLYKVGEDAEIEAFCTTDVCEIPAVKP